MSTTEQRHHWIVAPDAAARTAAREQLALPPVLAQVSADRRLRGPYTAAGSVLRALAADALARCPDAVARHDIEILTVAPELTGTVPASRETLTSLAAPRERTRFYARLRTLRIAHGLVEFLSRYTAALGDGPRTLVVDGAQHADPTDREFLAVLLRRADPELLVVVVTTDSEPLDEPEDPLASPDALLTRALDEHCVRRQSPGRGAEQAAAGDHAQPAGAAQYVASDGTSEDPRALAAYQALQPGERARLHDARRTELESLAETSLRLGAIVWHAEQGSDPAGAGADAAAHALNYCMDFGFYHAVLDYGVRGRVLVGYDQNPDHWWTFTSKLAIALSALGLADEALPLLDDARAVSTEPEIHLQAAYATAMLYTRHLDAERKDHHLARGWINEAIAFAKALPDPKERAMRTAFNRNGLALIETHQGRPLAALELLDQCISSLDSSLEPHEHALHRSVLRHNRAQVNAGLRRYDEAVADYTKVIAADPNYAEYHFDRGVTLRGIGQLEEALTDFDSAIRLSPPFVEAYYNRADVRAALGDVEGAVADFGYVIELDPAFADAYLNRASLYADLGEADAAADDVRAGLAVAADHAGLLTLSGQLHAAAGRPADAQTAYTAALAADPEFAQAWASRAELAYEEGDLAAAIAGLEQAVELSDEPGIAFNLAVALHDGSRFQEAVDRLSAVFEETGDPSAQLRRAASLLALGRAADARTDLLQALEADPGLTDEASDLVPELIA